MRTLRDLFFGRSLCCRYRIECATGKRPAQGDWSKEGVSTDGVISALQSGLVNPTVRAKSTARGEPEGSGVRLGSNCRGRRRRYGRGRCGFFGTIDSAVPKPVCNGVFVITLRKCGTNGRTRFVFIAPRVCLVGMGGIPTRG